MATHDTILGRRDVALVPWVTMCVVAATIAISAVLRGATTSPGGTDWSVVAMAVTGMVFTGFMVWLQDRPIGLRYRESMWVYLLTSAALLAYLAVLAIRGGGVATPYYLSTIPLSAYAGLAFPLRWSRPALLIVLAATVGVHLVRPEAGPFPLILVSCLIVAGWIVGSLGSLAHAKAAKVATAVSNYDQLTQMLNRRGLLAQVDRFLSGGDDGRNPLPGTPVALLMIDLDGFKHVNDRDGHAAGDELLAWVGEHLPHALPARAEVGRLGGDEFAVLLVDVTPEHAVAIARAVRVRLRERIGASIGVATSQIGLVEPDDLFREGDTALYVCKRDRALGVHGIAVDPAGAPRQQPARPAPKHPSLSYAELRATKSPPETPELGVVYGWMMSQGLMVIAVTGFIVVVATFLGDDRNIFDTIIRYTGIPWVLGFVGYARASHGRGNLEGRRFKIIIYGSGFSLGSGVAFAMLAGGGVTAPIGAALFLRVLFEAAIMPRRQAAFGLASMVFWWTVVAVFSPPSELWITPWALAMFGSAFALGSLGHRAFDDITRHTLALARTDPLTGLRNRLGFEQDAEAALAIAYAEHSAFTLLALDLDDFKLINDTDGHAAGDAVLRQVAKTLMTACPDSITAGRVGGDEFLVAIPVPTNAGAAARARELTAELGPLVGASVGYAVLTADRSDCPGLDALVRTADTRSYEQKRRKAERVAARLGA